MGEAKTIQSSMFGSGGQNNLSMVSDLGGGEPWKYGVGSGVDPTKEHSPGSEDRTAHWCVMLARSGVGLEAPRLPVQEKRLLLF